MTTLLLALSAQAPFVAQNGGPTLSVDRSTGRFDVGGAVAVRAAAGEVRLSDGRTLRTDGYARHEIATAQVRSDLGEALRVTVRHLGGGPELRQTFWLLRGRPEIVVRLDALGTSGSNEIAPVSTAQPVFPDAPQTLFVPYDNDSYVRYRSDARDATSHEVGARYDAGSRRGLIVGSIDHDVWKSGVSFKNGLRAFSGFVDKDSRDGQPHGTVTGGTVSSPRFVLGLYDDWRAGLERYGDLNARVRPPLPWRDGVPFGWNSWAAHMAKLTAANARAATDFIAELTPFRNEGRAYVNLDSFWDNLKPAELRAFVERAHAKGLRAGIYWTPFVAWGNLTDRADKTYLYRDLALKDAKGDPLPKLDGGWPLDPTHPGTLARIDRQLQAFVEQGFDFAKLDFMTHGALEGQHFDPKVTTGTAAYGLGMRRIVDKLSPKRIGRPFFISLSIAPLFPSGYAHSRRISCDAFADLGASEYLLNSATYGWWAAGRLYAYNDPDHTVVHHVLDSVPTTQAESRTRFAASLVAGGMMLNSDDLGDPAAQERVRRLFTNPTLLALARKAPSFLPVEGDSGERAGDAFVWRDGEATIFAAFNYSKSATTKKVTLARLGLSGEWNARDLWTGDICPVTYALSFDLLPADCALVRLERAR